MKIENFEVAIADDQVTDLRHRLTQTRWSPEIDNEDWKFGSNGTYLRQLIGYWANEFDWRVQESRINAFNHFRTSIDGVPIHFIHVPGRGPNPLPLILTHGWPQTFWDWHALIAPLSNPAAHGGDPADSFDVVIPSLPGYTFSNPLEIEAVNPPSIAKLWDKLMRDGLGYDRYGAGGGSWGTFVTAELGMQFPDHVIGVYMSTAMRQYGPEPVPESDYGLDELDWAARHAERRTRVGGHVGIHSSAPQTLAWALNDSPVGLAAWLIERRRNWSGCQGDIEASFTRDFLLTTVSLYWFTQSFRSSIQIYPGSFEPLRLQSQEPALIKVPSGIGVFPYDTTILPRKTCERWAPNLVHWSVLPRGGNFAASEEPELYINELRTFFRALR
jgi:pimeloyl-ACP methyl ester carboxylesterase